jgi:hypothetical protein
MAGMSNYLEQNFLDWYFRRATWTLADPYVRLFSTTPTDLEAGTGGTELSGTGYTQYGQLAARGATNWEVVSTGNGYEARNKLTGAFSWSVGSAWSTVNGAALFDGNLVGSNFLWGAALTTPRTPASGDTARFAAGVMEYKLDATTAAGLTNYTKQQLLNHLVIADQSSSGRVPATAYIALFTSATALNQYTGASGTEVSTAGTGYARLAVTSASAWHAAASVGTGYHIHNSSAFNGWAAATTAFGNIRYAALVDSASGTINQYYAIKQLASDQQIDAGDTFSIAADGWMISLDESN